MSSIQNTHKGEIARDRAIETLEDIMLLGLEFDFPLDSALSVRATELAHQFGLQATYDAYYLALAEREGCELWTSDTKMWRAVGGKFPWVRRLEDYYTSLEEQDITYHLNILGREGYACEGRHAEGDQQEKDLAGWWGSVLAHRSREFKDHLPKKQRSEHRQIVLG